MRLFFLSWSCLGSAVALLCLVPLAMALADNQPPPKKAPAPKATDKKPKGANVSTVRMLFTAEVQEKLGLNADQKAKIAQLKQEWDAKLGQYQQEGKAKLQGTLTDDQKKKLEELKKGLPAGVAADFRTFLTPEMQEKLGLNPDQKTKLAEARQDWATKSGELGKDIKVKQLEILNDEQKKKLDDLKREELAKKAKTESK